MDSTRQDIVVVWFKRDLRLIDHEPIMLAQRQNLPVLFVYCFEPSIMGYDDSDDRHWRFVYESLQDLQTKLLPYNTKVAIFYQEALFIFYKR
jgi:deoxyribodipyrimidine photo-lyase